MERGVALVGGMRIAKHRVRTVPGVAYRQLGGVGQVAGRTGRYQIMLTLAQKVRGRLTHVGRIGAREVRGVVARDVGVILGQIGADGLGVHALKVIVCLAVGGNDQIKVARAHIQGAQPLAHDGVGTCQRVGGQHRFILRAVVVHDLEPADEFLGLLVIDDVRTVHQRGGVQGRGGIVLARRNDQPKIFPVVKICRAVATHAPVPYFLLRIGVLLVFTVPVIVAVQVHDRAAVRLNALALGVKPYLTGSDAVIARCLICHNTTPFACPEEARIRYFPL